MTPRRRTRYFERAPGAPAPFTVTVAHRVQFGETDSMRVMWHGHFLRLFEEAATELRRVFGMGYAELYEARLQAPIVQSHVDHHRPLLLDQIAHTTARLVWCDAARMDVEYEVLVEDGPRAATGYTVQMLVDAVSGEPCLCSPELLCRCRRRWRESAVGAGA